MEEMAENRYHWRQKDASGLWKGFFMKTALKILLIAFISTAIRITMQIFIPGDEQTVLAPSVFVEEGTLPIVFSVYAFFGYSIIAAMYLLVEERITGARVFKGLKYGAACCLIWVVYLFEPLPHNAGADFIILIAYPVADGLGLIVMGLLIGLLISKESVNIIVQQNISGSARVLISFIILVACFITGRILQYTLFDIYSLFDTQRLNSLSWTTITGIAISAVFMWFNKLISHKNRVKKALLIGVALYGINISIFNFFALLVFKIDLADLLIRTFADIGFLTLGALLLPANNFNSRSR